MALYSSNNKRIKIYYKKKLHHLNIDAILIDMLDGETFITSDGLLFQDSNNKYLTVEDEK